MSKFATSTRLQQRWLGLAAAALSATLSAVTITPAMAGDLYAWVIADNFCEYLGYGMKGEDAFRKAFGEVLSNSIHKADYDADAATKLPDGTDVAVTRIAAQIGSKCGVAANQALTR